MKYKNLVFFVGALIIVTIFGFTVFYNKNQDIKDDEKNINDVDGSVDNVEKKDAISDIIDNMTLEEKIGQMLVIDFNVTEVNDKFKTMFESVKPGGVILMGNNYSTFEGTKKLISDIKSLSSIPLIVSTDQEGGRVQRLQKLTDVKPTFIPDMYSLGKTMDESLAYQVGKVMALEMRTLGINVVNAPVLDIFSNPKNTVIGNRSFGSDASLVSKMGLSLARGLEENGVMPTFKHFPGHGDTDTDSHTSLPVVDKSYKDLSDMELIPFKSAISSGAEIVMTAHISLPNVTGNSEPASLSKHILTDILRKDLGFDGIIITDALNMKALTDNYSLEDIYLKAVNAGADILLMPSDVMLAIETIKDNVSESRIDESVRRILQFKYDYLVDYEYTDKSVLGSQAHIEIMEKINYGK